MHTGGIFYFPWHRHRLLVSPPKDTEINNLVESQVFTPNNVPGPEIEPRPVAWQADVLTTTLPRLSDAMYVSPGLILLFLVSQDNILTRYNDRQTGKAIKSQPPPVAASGSSTVHKHDNLWQVTHAERRDINTLCALALRPIDGYTRRTQWPRTGINFGCLSDGDGCTKTG